MSDAELGAALLWVGLGALLTIRWVDGLTDRAERWVLPVSVAALGTVGVVPVFVHGVVALSAALLLIGVCSGGVDAAINAAAVRTQSRGRPVLNLAHGLFSLAVVASSLGVAALTDVGEGRAWALGVVGVVLLAAAAVTAVCDVAVAGSPVSSQARGVGLSWPLLVLGTLAACAYLVENAWQSWGAIQLHATVGASLRVAAFAPAVFALAAAAGRLGAHRLPSSISPAALFGTSAALAAAGSALAALGPTIGWVLGGIAVAGLGTSVCADADCAGWASTIRPSGCRDRHGDHHRLPRVRWGPSGCRTGRRRFHAACRTDRGRWPRPRSRRCQPATRPAFRSVITVPHTTAHAIGLGSGRPGRSAFQQQGDVSPTSAPPVQDRSGQQRPGHRSNPHECADETELQRGVAESVGVEHAEVGVAAQPSGLGEGRRHQAQRETGLGPQPQ